MSKNSLKVYLPGIVWVENKKDGVGLFICYPDSEWRNVFMVKTDKDRKLLKFFSGVNPEEREVILKEIDNVDAHGDDYEVIFHEKIDINNSDLLH